MAKKHTLESVKQEFADGGLMLMATEYVNIKTPLAFTCTGGHTGKTTFIAFQKGIRCPMCARANSKKVKGGDRPLSQDQVG